MSNHICQTDKRCGQFLNEMFCNLESLLPVRIKYMEKFYMLIGWKHNNLFQTVGIQIDYNAFIIMSLTDVKFFLQLKKS